MSATKFLVDRLGADYRQWQALTAVINRDQRDPAGGRATNVNIGLPKVASASYVLWALVGLLFAGLSLRQPTISEESALVLSLFVATLFAALVTGNNGRDVLRWELLQSLPVSNRTFFVCHLTTSLRRARSVATLTSAPTLLLVLVREGYLAAIVWVGAVAFSSVFVACLVGAIEDQRRRAAIRAAHRPRRKGTTARSDTRRWTRLPPEARVCATLFLAHLRRDADFRLRLLASLPVGLVALLLSVLDFFEVEAVAHRLDEFMAVGLVHLAALVVPLAYLDATRRSNDDGAKWTFASTSVDMGKVLFWTGVIVCVFALPFLIVVAFVLFLLLGGGWRSIGHAMNLILLIYVVFNVVLARKPDAPFSMPPTRQRAVSVVDFIGNVMGWGFVFLFLPMLLSAASSSLWSAAGLAVALLVAVAGLRQVVVKQGRARTLMPG